MSSRNIRRLVAEKERQERERKKAEEKENEEPTEEATEEFSPHVVHMNPAYEGLEVSSGSESELSVLSDPGYQDEAAAVPVIPEEDKYGAKKKTYTNTEAEKKKKKKNKNKKKSNKKPDGLDEIDRSLRAVNRLLGSPMKKEEVVVVVDENDLAEKRIFSVHTNHINVNYELAKVFGEEERLRKYWRGTRRKRHEIGLSPDINPFQIKGLSMTRYKTIGDIKYFKFEHTQDYKSRCRALVGQLKSMLFGQVIHEPNLHAENCVEALLENCDFLYYVEEHKGANQALEQAIYSMQSVGEPSFNFVDGKTRLDYEYVENRPFHIAILKYLHVLTNIACHRTALELAKVLLNLDPTDPLAVIFIIDTLAIRAREHQWLLDLIEFWRDKRQAHRLFHMRYSRALAMFHVACKKKDYGGIEAAKNVLMKAIKHFPSVAVKIMEFSKVAIPDNLNKHDLFTPPARLDVGPDLNELMTLYAWLIGPRWREPRVWNWFMDTISDLTNLYDLSSDIRKQVRDFAMLRAQLYRRIPTQMKRHLYAIRPMAKYISEGRMPHTNPSVSFNPYPCEGLQVDTYNYFTEWLQQYAPPENAFMALIQGGLRPNLLMQKCICDLSELTRNQLTLLRREAYNFSTFMVFFKVFYHLCLYVKMYDRMRDMGEMLERMDGMEIRVPYGSYLVVGPTVYQPAEQDGIRTYRVVFVRRRTLPAPEVNAAEPEVPQNNEPHTNGHEPQGQLLNGNLNHDNDERADVLQLEGNFNIDDDADFPLLNDNVNDEHDNDDFPQLNDNENLHDNADVLLNFHMEIIEGDIVDLHPLNEIINPGEEPYPDDPQLEPEDDTPEEVIR